MSETQPRNIELHYQGQARSFAGTAHSLDRLDAHGGRNATVKVSNALSLHDCAKAGHDGAEAAVSVA